ncbi:MAG: endonuclease III domain-containing protein [Candidatus Omnitrophica bacterium]|nr:endonuclease III domain-containing protein [Candidatus Omnitrophota bacterium]
MKSSKPTRFQKKRKLKPAQLARVYAALRKAFGHQQWWPGETPFEVMIGAILTQNTAWTNVEKAILNLKKSGKLSFEALRRVPAKKLAQLIRPAGYFNVKADRLKCFMDFLHRECGGDLSKLKRNTMPVLREKLLAVRGVGPETADSILLYALDKTSFVIDVYTRRIFSRHGLAKDHETYEAWREIFTRALPERRDLFNDFHAQIVRTGKDYCRKVPRCERCPLRRFF